MTGPVRRGPTRPPLPHHPSVTCTCGHQQIDHVVTATGDDECWRCQCPHFETPETAELARLRAALTTIVDRWTRTHHSYEPADQTHPGSEWHNGYVTALATTSIIANEALDPEGTAAANDRMSASGHATDREWLNLTGHCGHCGMLARLCCCTPDDPCACGPHEIDPWPRPCWTCDGLGEREWNGPGEPPGGHQPSRAEAARAVVDAAIVETRAEQAATATTTALTAPNRSAALTVADDARRAVQAARTARRNAVEHLLNISEER